MRNLTVSAAAALVLAVQLAPSAQAADNPIIRKNNDAGASSTVIRKDEPPLTAIGPHDSNKPIKRQDQ